MASIEHEIGDETRADDLDARGLIETITSLRSALEAEAADRERFVQVAVQNAVDENAQLHASVVELRRQLELLTVEKDKAVQEQRQASAEEIAQLKTTVQRLRSELEEQTRDHHEAVAANERAFTDERAQLAATITVLRDRLEALDAKLVVASELGHGTTIRTEIPCGS